MRVVFSHHVLSCCAGLYCSHTYVGLNWCSRKVIPRTDTPPTPHSSPWLWRASRHLGNNQRSERDAPSQLTTRLLYDSTLISSRVTAGGAMGGASVWRLNLQMASPRLKTCRRLAAGVEQHKGSVACPLSTAPAFQTEKRSGYTTTV